MSTTVVLLGKVEVVASALRMLFVGGDWYGSNASSLRDAFTEVGLDVRTINTHQALGEGWGHRRLRKRIFGSVGTGPLESLRSELRKNVASWRPQVVFAFRTLWMSVEDLDMISSAGALAVHYHPDDTGNPENVSASYLEAEKYWAIHVTTKTFNVTELESRGAQRVLYVPCAYDARWHLPTQSLTKPWPISFIGTSRPERRDALLELARTQRSVPIRIAGGGWRRDLQARRQLRVSGPVYGRDMSALVSASAVNLGFLNRQNRDLHTCRSYEVPAAGGFFLAERSSEHEALLEEGKEAEFFTSDAEMADKATYYAGRPDLARAIARAGHIRILRSEATYHHRARTIVSALGHG